MTILLVSHFKPTFQLIVVPKRVRLGRKELFRASNIAVDRSSDFGVIVLSGVVICIFFSDIFNLTPEYQHNFSANVG